MGLPCAARSGGAGLRIFMGTMLGLIFFLLGPLFSYLGVLNDWPRSSPRWFRSPHSSGSPHAAALAGAALRSDLVPAERVPDHGDARPGLAEPSQ